MMFAVSASHADPRRVSTLSMEPDSQTDATTDAATPSLTAQSAPVEKPRQHAIYVEGLGKGGVWGLGYEHRLGNRLGIGAVGSFTMLSHQRVYSLTPYVLAYPVRGKHHSWFADVGPTFVRIATPSPVPEWSGSATNGIGGEVSTGWEYRN
ncbi:MAG TPA: hypothetical protein VLB44_26770, partial [Kofleriaceae bacterium]|nr:hypothetical protein [Kofleriaceae bacterium]